MKRVLVMLAACGDPDPGAPTDAPLTIPIDAPATPAMLTARVFPPGAPSVKQHQAFTFAVNVTNLGGTDDSDPGFTANGTLDLHDCTSIHAGGMCQYDVTETVDQLGAQDWSFSTFMPALAGTLSATGTTPDPLAAEPGELHFAGVQLTLAQPPTRTVRLRNNTSASLGPLALSLADPTHHFTLAASCDGTTLAAGAVCDVDVTYMPTTTPPLGAGPDTATLSVTAGARSTAVTIDGYATSLLLAPISPTNQLQLPDAFAGQSGGTRVFTVTNVVAEAVGPLAVKAIHADGTPANEIALRDDTCTGKTLAFGSTCTFGYGLAMPSPGMAIAIMSVTAPDTAQHNETGSELYGYSVSRN